MIHVVRIDNYFQLELIKPVEFVSTPDISNLRNRFNNLQKKETLNNTGFEDYVKLCNHDSVNIFSECLSEFCIFSSNITELRKVTEKFAEYSSYNLAKNNELVYVSYIPGSMLTDVIIIESILQKNPQIKKISYHQFIMDDLNIDYLSSDESLDNISNDNIRNYYQITRHRYACLMTIFALMKLEMNLFCHTSLQTNCPIRPHYIVGNDYTDESYSFSTLFEKLVLKFCVKDTIIINMYKYMEDIADYLKSNFHSSIKICQTEPNHLIDHFEIDSISKVHDAYNLIDFRTIYEIDNKKYKYVTLNFLKFTAKTLFKCLFLRRV